MARNTIKDFHTNHYFVLCSSSKDYSFTQNHFIRCNGGQEPGGAFVTFERLTEMEVTISFTDTLFSECHFKKLGGLNFGSATLKSLTLTGLVATSNGNAPVLIWC